MFFQSISTYCLKNFDLLLEKQKINCVYGPNDSGKTLLLHNLVYRSSLEKVIPFLEGIKIKLPFSSAEIACKKQDSLPPAVDLNLLAQTIDEKRTIGDILGIDNILHSLALKEKKLKCKKNNCQLAICSPLYVSKEIKEQNNEQNILVTIPIKAQKVEQKVSRLIESGYSRYVVNDRLIKISEVGDEVSLFVSLEKDQNIYAVISSFQTRENEQQEIEQLLNESLEIAYGIKENSLVLFLGDTMEFSKRERLYCRNSFYCESCDKTLAFSELQGLLIDVKKSNSEIDFILEEHSLSEIRQYSFRNLEKLSIVPLRDIVKHLVESGFAEYQIETKIAVLNFSEKIKLLFIYYILSALSDVLFVLDSPLRYFSLEESKYIFKASNDLIANGNTLLLSETKSEFVNKCEVIILLPNNKLDHGNYPAPDLMKLDGIRDFEFYLKNYRNNFIQINTTSLAESEEFALKIKNQWTKLKKLQSPSVKNTTLKILDTQIDKKLLSEKYSLQTIAEFLSLDLLFAELFSSLMSAKKLGLKRQDFLLSSKNDSSSDEVRWNGVCYREVLSLDVATLSQNFQTRKEFCGILDEMIFLEFSKINLSRKISSLSSSERVLAHVLREFIEETGTSDNILILENVFSGLDTCKQVILSEYLNRKSKENILIINFQIN